MKLNLRVERYLRRTGMKPTRLGREALGDPRFVFDLRNGREPRSETAARLNAWLDRQEGRPSCEA